MAVRQTMAWLIDRTRSLIGDDDMVISDQTIQDALDARRTDVYQQRLTAAPLPSSGQLQGAASHFYAEYGDWEEGAELLDSGGSALTPTSAEPFIGHWSFDPPVAPPVYLTGRYFDVYAAAADLLEQWAAKHAREFDFAPRAGKSYSRSQKHAQLLTLAATYRMQQRPTVGAQTRDDLAGNPWA